MLHIFNGDSTANLFKATNLPGIRLTWREALIDGPNPQNTPLNEWINIRAAHLADSSGKDAEGVRSTLQKQEDTLLSYLKHEEVVLWFEYDLFCQVNLIYLLNFFAQHNTGKTKLSLICINEYPGVEPFYGLGQLDPEQLASLFSARQPVTAKILKSARQAWLAYTSPNPQQIEAFLKDSDDSLPFIRNAFAAHLARFPSTRNGLGLIENKALDLIASGVDEFQPLFPMFQELHPIYGLGDLQFWQHLYKLSQTTNPLLQVFNVNGAPPKKQSHQDAYFKLTNTGKAILVGNSDMLNLNHVDYWLGGVHLSYENDLWRWDEEKRKLCKDEDHI